MVFRITSLAFLVFLANVACSNLGVSSLSRGDADEFDDDLSLPANTTGSFLTSCDVASGQLTCDVSYKDQIIQFGTSTYPYEPDYIVYQSKNLFEDTPESLEDGDVFSYEATSVPEGDVNATFVFNPIDIEYFASQILGDSKLSYSEKRRSNVGQILTYHDRDYLPENPKKFVVLDRCLQGVLTDSWLNPDGSGVVGSNITLDDLASYPYTGKDQDVLDEMKKVEDAGGSQADINIAAWRKSLEIWVSTYVDETPLDQPAGEPYTCRAEYEKFKAGQINTLFDQFEKQLGELVKDFLVSKGEEI